jgi:hypothetical protein
MEERALNIESWSLLRQKSTYQRDWMTTHGAREKTTSILYRTLWEEDDKEDIPGLPGLPSARAATLLRLSAHCAAIR